MTIGYERISSPDDPGLQTRRKAVNEMSMGSYALAGVGRDNSHRVVLTDRLFAC